MLAVLTDFLLPALCGLCGSRVDQTGALCAACWHKLTFIAPPCCVRCGVPFTTPAAAGLECAACLADPPSYSKARAALVYDEVGRKLISRFKYGDKLHLLPTFVPWLQRAATDLQSGVDVIVPVPLHWSRLWRRRYNQSALLARALGQVTGLPVDLHGLRRTRRTARQVGMTRAQRLKNVRDAFAVRTDYTGRIVLLMDDVHTTGATLEACTTALQNAGAQEVRVLTLARVVRPEQVDA